MNLGHGRAGHLPDYSFIRYKYLPMWGEYKEIIKDNPSDYLKAFTQMIYAMKYIRGDISVFKVNEYDEQTIRLYLDRIKRIIEKRQIEASADWKTFGEELSKEKIDDFIIDKYFDEYTGSSKKEDTFIERFTKGAIAHKGMVIEAIQKSNNRFAGVVKKLYPIL